MSAESGKGPRALLAYAIEGERTSCRTKLSLLAATLHFRLKHPERGSGFRDLLRKVKTFVATPGGVAFNSMTTST